MTKSVETKSGNKVRGDASTLWMPTAFWNTKKNQGKKIMREVGETGNTKEKQHTILIQGLYMGRHVYQNRITYGPGCCTGFQILCLSTLAISYCHLYGNKVSTCPFYLSCIVYVIS